MWYQRGILFRKYLGDDGVNISFEWEELQPLANIKQINYIRLQYVKYETF